MIAVRDVEASSRWYQHLLGLKSDHGGPHYERLLAGGVLVLQLHDRETEHHHGRIGGDGEVGNGVLLWFGEVSDFDDVVARARELGAAVARPPHQVPEGQGSGPGHRELWVKDGGYGRRRQLRRRGVRAGLTGGAAMLHPPYEHAGGRANGPARGR